MNLEGPTSDSKTRKGGASAGWLAVISAGIVLFLFARAIRWTEGVTFDDTVTLLLGALPFACFYVLGSAMALGSPLFAFFSLAWILTLTVFLGVRLSPLIYVVDPYLNSISLPASYVRLIASFFLSLIGTGLTSALYWSFLRSEGFRAFGYMIVTCAFNALYIWVFIYLLPPDLSFLQER